jgi:hypothetical protein
VVVVSIALVEKVKVTALFLLISSEGVSSASFFQI